MFKRFADILRDLFDGIIVVGGKMTDFNIGSVARTILEAAAAVMEELWFMLEWFVDRFFLATSEGEWLDRRLGDILMKRKAGKYAAGEITVGRDSPSPIGSLIPKGTIWQTDSGIEYETTIEASLLAGMVALDIPAQCRIVGAAGNQPQDTPLNQAGVAIVGLEWGRIKQMGGGLDTETDTAFVNRVPDYLASLSRAVQAAIRTAALAVPGVRTVTLAENQPQDGWFTVYVDDGGGSASPALLAAVAAAVEEVRGFTIRYLITTATRRWVELELQVSAKDGYIQAEVGTAVRTAIVAMINSLAMGQQLLLLDLYAVIRAVDGVANARIISPTAFLDYL